ncbi:glycosyltransferase [Pontimicrobium sp. IMCC45349]|uniref:glycosyltransferase n=1 Tax=Pontimicrobium sp. IMCC45349 TaxID=3391574 RepID=UPI00399F685B
MELKKRILVAPLNWGLGHATRCIPIINALISQNYEPIIASDGIALKLLKKEFPNLEAITLPSYKVTYSKKGKHFKLKLLKDSPKMLKAIKAEKEQVKNLLKATQIDGIISDNRLGVYSKKVPSVFISHQLNVLSGSTTWLSSKIHQNIIKKFDECWIPDLEDEPNLSGKLGHLEQQIIPMKYLGVVSRFNKLNIKKVYDLTVLLSGPEPQRSMLEEYLLEELTNYNGKVLFVKGCVESKQNTIIKKNITIINFMQTKELEIAINQSDIILSRSGYTTVLDLAKLEKKAFFIPTPGQFEQEYLAKRLDEKGITPYCSQDKFTIYQLARTENYKGFNSIYNSTDFSSLFNLFERK